MVTPGEVPRGHQAHPSSGRASAAICLELDAEAEKAIDRALASGRDLAQGDLLSTSFAARSPATLGIVAS